MLVSGSPDPWPLLLNLWLEAFELYLQAQAHPGHQHKVGALGSFVPFAQFPTRVQARVSPGILPTTPVLESFLCLPACSLRLHLGLDLPLLLFGPSQRPQSYPNPEGSGWSPTTQWQTFGFSVACLPEFLKKIFCFP